MEKRGAFVVLSLVFFVLLLLILPSVLSVIDNTTLRDSLLDEDFREEIRETDSVRVPSTDNLLFKSYDASEKSLLIEDDNFDMVVELKLLTDYNIHVGVGKDIKVAEFLLIDYSFEGDLFEALIFYDVKSEYKEVGKSFKLKYAVDSLVEVCNDVEKFGDGNVSLGFESVCSDVLRVDWMEFDSLSEIPSRNIRVGIFTDTVLGEEIEWVLTIEGFEVLEWASYLVDGVVAYYKLDEISGVNVLNSVGGVNGTANDEIIFTSATEGIIGNSANFTLAGQDYIDTNSDFDIGGTKFATFNMWLKPTDVSVSHYFFGKRTQANNANMFYWVIGGQVGFFTYDGEFTGNTQQTTSALNTSAWSMVTFVMDDANWQLYFNGISETNNDNDHEFIDGGNWTVGAIPHDGQWIPSFMDEVGIWNIALNDSAILELYQNGRDGLSYPFAGDNFITFNVTDSYSGVSLDNVLITCNYSEFNQSGDTTNTYGPYAFAPNDSYECEFEQTVQGYYNKTIVFVADSDKTVDVLMSDQGYLTTEEHTWLEAIYDCIVGGDCSLYDMISTINGTVANIWEYTAPTDESVVLNETVTNKVVDASNNLTIDYSVYVPIKAGYSLGAYLPIRIGYFFLDSTNTTCYNQGEELVGVVNTSCSPLIVETIGPMGGTVNFTVELQPALVQSDNYSIKRIIDIDPLGVWYNYGSEVIGSFVMMEGLSVSGSSIEVNSDGMPSNENSESTLEDTIVEISLAEDDEEDFVSSVVGGVVGAGRKLFSGWQLVICLALISGVLVTYMITRMKIKMRG